MVSRKNTESVGKTKDLHPCICGCGDLTARRYFPGCDTAFYGHLRHAMRCGDALARLVYDNIFKQNRRATFPKQRRLAQLWRDRQQELAAIAAD